MHLEAAWDYPDAAAVFERLASFARVVMWNRRGVGLSDRLSLDERTTIDSGLEDVLAVLDALELPSVSVFASGAGVPLAAVLTATHPERVRALVLTDDPSRPAWGPDRDAADALFERWDAEVTSRWGTGVLAAAWSPSRALDRRYVEWMARMERLTATPRTAAAMWPATYATDVSDVLPTIRRPTLVLHMLGWYMQHGHLTR